MMSPVSSGTAIVDTVGETDRRLTMQGRRTEVTGALRYLRSHTLIARSELLTM